MSTSAKRTDSSFVAVKVEFTDNFICLTLTDGREVRTPLKFYPRLEKADPNTRKNFKLIGEGTGIHWPTLDEDLSVEGIVLGRKSQIKN
jgi:hypothetical protein